MATPFVKRYAGGAAGSSAKTILRSLGDHSCSVDVARGSTDVERADPGKAHARNPEFVAQSKLHGGGDGAVDFGADRRPGRVITFQDQLKRVFGFS